MAKGKILTFTGYCPAKDKTDSIKILYVNASAIEDIQACYTKDQNKCPPDCENCPIWNSAPQFL